MFNYCLLWQVARTEFGKQLPIYSDFRNGRTRKVTILRKIDGDVEACRVLSRSFIVATLMIVPRALLRP